MNDCHNCANMDNEYCFACDNGNQFKPMTNADHSSMDFNTTIGELKKCLSLCFERNGEIYWYEGTLELLFKLLSFLGKEKKNE